MTDPRTLAHTIIGGECLPGRHDAICDRMTAALERARNEALDQANQAALNATLPEGYQWGDDAMHSFNFGKVRASVAIVALKEQPHDH